MFFIVLQFTWAVFAIMQAYHNYYSFYIDDYQNPKYKEYNELYHQFQLVREIGITLLVSILLHNWESFFILFTIRFIFFQYSLNIISNKGVWYLSDRGTDKILKNILGKHASKIILGISVILIILLNIL